MSIERVKVESQQELEQMVTREIDQLEKDLNVICNDVQINDKTTLDVLCHDVEGQLVIIQISVNEDDVMLLQGIQSLDYIDKFKSFLKATYSKNKIDDKLKPRLILIAPSFSDAVRRAVESMKGIRIELFEWEYLRLGDHKGLRLQPVFMPASADKSADKKESKHESKSSKKKEQETPINTEEAVKSDTVKEDFPTFPSAEENPTEEKPIFRSESEEPQKKKLKLF